mgnify:CR=1 FL=1
MKNNMKGGGSWTSLCPICGIHFRVTFTNKIDFDELLKSIDKSPKLLDMSKKEWKENKEKYIENFHEFKKIEKHTFRDYNKITILIPNSKIIHNAKYIDNNDFKKGDKHFGEVYLTEKPIYDDKKYATYGLPMHTECWNIAKKKFNHELKLDDFLFNKNISSPIKYLDRGYTAYLLEKIKYGDVLEYSNQDLYDEKLILNKKHWYMYYLPSGKSEESQKNSKRIEKIISSNIKGIKKQKEEKIPIKKLKKDRPSPSESATLFKVNTKKKGNDGNIYVVVVNKNGVKRWKKID